MLGVQRVRREEVEGAAAMRDGDVHNAPYVVEHRGEVLILYLGVIDFLQGWNTGKKVAHVIKRCFWITSNTSSNLQIRRLRVAAGG